jgi:hypothetical protein
VQALTNAVRDIEKMKMQGQKVWDGDLSDKKILEKLKCYNLGLTLIMTLMQIYRHDIKGDRNSI